MVPKKCTAAHQCEFRCAAKKFQTYKWPYIFKFYCLKRLWKFFRVPRKFSTGKCAVYQKSLRNTDLNQLALLFVYMAMHRYSQNFLKVSPNIFFGFNLLFLSFLLSLQMLALKVKLQIRLELIYSISWDSSTQDFSIWFFSIKL